MTKISWLVPAVLWATVHSASAADWQRTVVFIHGPTQSGQDLFVRGGIDHGYAQAQLGRACTAQNLACAIPIQHRNLNNATTAPWKQNEQYLDWYGAESGQSSQAQGTPMDWTTNLWSASWGSKRTVDSDGYGETPLNAWGQHYWMLDVLMDCSATVNGWFELKSFISNGPGWEADVSQAGTPYASGNHFAQCGKINKFERGSNAALIQAFPGVNKVYLQVDRADDHLQLLVDGVERLRWSATHYARELQPSPQARLGEKIDITHLIGQGSHRVRLLSTSDNWGGFNGGYQVKLWADSNLLLDSQQSLSRWGSFSAIGLDQSVQLTLNAAPATYSLQILPATAAGEAIYLNNVFTGKTTPATFNLVAGDYRIGLGASTTTADWSQQTVLMTGQYRQQDLHLSANTSLNGSSLPILNSPHQWRVAAIPFSQMHHGLTVSQIQAGQQAPASNLGVMTAEDIQVAEQVIKATSDRWLLPMSYGLMQWQVTMLDPVSQPVFNSTDQGLLLEGIQFSQDLSQFDMVIYLMPNLTANGQYVTDNFGATGGRPFVHLPSSWANATGATLAQRLAKVQPSSGLLHESLHNFDNYRLTGYNGLDQLHGAEIHGYGASSCGLPSEWVCWYRDYIRSQVVESPISRTGVVRTSPLPVDDSSLFVGVFEVARGGNSVEQLRQFSRTPSPVRNPASQHCLDVSNGSLADNAAVIGWSCHGGSNQSWSLQRLSDRSYQLVNSLSEKCLERNNGQLVQRRCALAGSQRWLLDSLASDVQIRDLTGQCLTLNASLGLQSCVANQASQQWRLE